MLGHKKRIMALAVLALTLSGYRAWASEPRWDVKEHFLSNGLKVLLLEDHRAPVLTFQVWYRVGSRNEAPGQTGLSHMLEHMMFKGTPQYGPGVFSNLVQKQGGRHNAFTSRDYTAYFETLASDRAEVALKLEADRMVNLLLDPEEIARERRVVMEERRSSVENRPERELFEKVAATAYKVHPYRWPIIGWAEDIRNFNREKLLSHYRKYYTPGNATLILVGDFDAADMLKLVERYFGSIPAGPSAPKLNSVEPPQRRERRVTLERVARLPSAVMAFHVPNILSPDAFPLEVLAAILGGGKSSRLHQELVYRRGMALSSEADYSLLSADPGLLYVNAQASRETDVRELESAARQVVERLKEGLVGEEELARAKKSLRTKFILAQDSQFYRAMLLGRAESVAGWRLVKKYLQHIEAVRAEDVRRVARRYLVAENRTVGTLIPLKGKAPAKPSAPVRHPKSQRR